MPLPIQPTYYILAWDNGVHSVHPNLDSAKYHISSLRGEVDNFSNRDRAPERFEHWKKIPVHIITVFFISEETL